jgi:hypothetical protein
MGSKRAYRSGFEEELGSVLCPAGALYEPYKIPYWTPRNYTPDFVLENDEVQILVEAKGYFRAGDTAKYKAIRDACAEGPMELVFILQYPNKKVRKGSKLTMSQWCDKEKIKWFSRDNIHELLVYNTSPEEEESC